MIGFRSGMEIREGLGVALGAIRANKLRALLTMLGIIIGVGAVITMISLGRGAQRAVAERIQALGSNLLFVFPGAVRVGGVVFQAGSRVSLELEDARVLEGRDHLFAAVVPEFSRPAQLKLGNRNWNSRVVGTTAVYQWVRNFHPGKGRFFTGGEEKTRARVCLLGATVAENLFPGGEDPVGKTIKVNRQNFQVIGVLETKGQSGFQNPDDQVLVPLETARRRLFGVDFLTGITLQVRDAAAMEEALLEAERVLRRQHRLRPAQENDFTIRNQADIVAVAEETSRTLTFLLASVAAVSLLVGGIGIMNIMLVSVTERTREIGIRKALGARRRDILLQFLIEALSLGLAGGLVGILIGVGSSLGLNRLAHWNTQLSPDAILLSFTFAALVGIFFGLYPARRAARLDPIESLRYE